MKSIRSEVDPAQIEELERTKGILHFWEKQLQSMVWNIEDEDGRMIRTVDEPHKMVLNIVGFEDKDISGLMQFPGTRRELLDLLRVKVVAFQDRVEVGSIFPIKIVDYQLNNPGCRSARCPQSR